MPPSSGVCRLAVDWLQLSFWYMGAYQVREARFAAADAGRTSTDTPVNAVIPHA